MKVQIEELESGMQITLIPETPADFGKVLRFNKNHREKKPSISLNFYRSSEPNLTIWMENISRGKQENSIKK